MFDAFISYSRQDNEWAQKLYEDLQVRGINAFKDTERITAGDIWRNELQVSLRSSRHLIVIWSDNARVSDWVQSELKYFEIDRGEDNRRRLVALNLQGENKTLTEYERIDTLRTAGAYAGGANNVSGPLWSEVLDKIEEAVKDDAIPVYTVILTSTLPHMKNIPLERRPNPLAPPYANTLEAIGIKKNASDDWKGELEKYYGESRSQWKPFAGLQTIEEILNDLRNSILGRSGAPRFRWRPIGGDFWLSDFEKVTAEADKLIGQVCVIVIDPLSLYDENVPVRIDLLKSRLQERSGISVLAPYSISPASAHLRSLLQRSAEELYNQFYLPGFNGAMDRGQIGVCEDRLDIGRLISVMLRPLKQEVRLHPVLKT